MHYVRDELLWEGVCEGEAVGEAHTGHIHWMGSVDPGQGCGSSWTWDPISLNTCFTNQPEHSTERRQDTAGQHKWLYLSQIAWYLGLLGSSEWLDGAVTQHPWALPVPQNEDQSFRGQGCSMTLAKCDDRFGDSLLYLFEKGQILFSTLDRKLADLA